MSMPFTPNATMPGPYSAPGEMPVMESEASLMALYEQSLDTLERYATENPWQFGLIMLGLGFWLGWKLKFW